MSNKTKERIIKNGLVSWNKQKLTSALTQGILQGESIPKIAKRFRDVADMDYKQSIRTARTSMTSAQNGGRQDSFIRAKDMGINQKKQWLATIDDRTRHEHRLLDGQRVDIEEPFRVEGYEILYPADPSAEPEMVYNCRCTMVTMFDGYDKKITDFDIDERLGDMTYDEWKKSKNIKSEPIDKQEKQGEAIKRKYNDDYRRMKKS
jgi:SPP1 gp7 family putative phage head morphogenesis protein